MATEARIAELPSELRYIQYDMSLESQYLPSIRALIGKDLSEPYSIYVYRYFLYQWGDLCFMVPSIFVPFFKTNTNHSPGSPPRDFRPYRCHHQQTGAPPITPLALHYARLHCDVGCLLRLSESRHCDDSCAACH
jgi:hypothetical protein